MGSDDIVSTVIKTMHGWGASPVETLQDIANVLTIAEGNHLEIGTFFGASAIIAALVKQQNGKNGKIYCIDPMVFTGMVGAVKRDSRFPRERGMYPVFMENIELFGLVDQIKLVRKSSHPFPEELDGMRFGSAFIDGCHTWNYPLWDVQEAMQRTDGFIVVDDVTPSYPDVVKAYQYALSSREWKLHLRLKFSVTLKKVW
jgi:predicted O-methyltransferase YrrM